MFTGLTIVEEEYWMKVNGSIVFILYETEGIWKELIMVWIAQAVWHWTVKILNGEKLFMFYVCVYWVSYFILGIFSNLNPPKTKCYNTISETGGYIFQYLQSYTKETAKDIKV